MRCSWNRMMSGNCSTATCRLRRWLSCSAQPTSKGNSHQQHDARWNQAAHIVLCSDQTAVSTAPMPGARPWRRRQRPAAAQRCAKGAGLDGGDRGRSTMSCAVHRTSDMLTTSLTRADASMSTFTTPRIYTCLTDATARFPARLPMLLQACVLATCPPRAALRSPSGTLTE